MFIIVLVVLAWIACGVAAAGGMVAYILGKYPKTFDYREALSEGCLLAVLGPIALFMSIFITQFWRYGWRLLPRRK